MGIRIRVDSAAVQKELGLLKSLVSRALSASLQKEGAALVDFVVSRQQEASWFNQTGNLRSSVGYVLANRAGAIEATGGFSKVLEGAEGQATGRTFGESCARDNESSYKLAVVAGMDYAAYVEAKDSKDVLATARLVAENDIPHLMQDIKDQIEKGA